MMEFISSPFKITRFNNCSILSCELNVYGILINIISFFKQYVTSNLSLFNCLLNPLPSSP